MNTKCPNCGAVHSLDSLLAHNGASEAIVAVANLSGELGKLVVQYCGLFRPKKSQLTFDRLATLINDLLPMMENQRIERNGQLFEAPYSVWVQAFKTVINNRTTLKLPLKSHGYLLEVISTCKIDDSVLMPVQDQPHGRAAGQDGYTGGISQMEAGIMALRAMRR